MVYPIASVDGLFFTQDRVTVTEGWMADPNRPNEIIMSASAAELLGVNLGESIPWDFFTSAQEGQPGFGRSTPGTPLPSTVRWLSRSSPIP
jgi:hypothetical protein